MIVIERLLRAVQIEIVLRQLVPRQLRDRLQVRHDDRILGTRRRDVGQPLQLALRLLHHRGRRRGRFDFLPELLDLLLHACSFSPSSRWIAFTCSRR